MAVHGWRRGTAVLTIIYIPGAPRQSQCQSRLRRLAAGLQAVTPFPSPSPSPRPRRLLASPLLLGYGLGMRFACSAEEERRGATWRSLASNALSTGMVY